MNYSDFSSPKSLYSTNQPQKDYSTLSNKENYSSLIQDIVSFSKSIEDLWDFMRIDGWETLGVKDLKVSNSKILIAPLSTNMRSELNYEDNSTLFKTYIDLVYIKINEILLNENEFVKNDIVGRKYGIPELSQLLFMELGNLKNVTYNTKKIWDNIKNVEEEKFVEDIEKSEFEIRMEIIRAFKKGYFQKDRRFPDPKCIFDVNTTNFDTYYKDSKSDAHKMTYRLAYRKANKKK